VMIKILFSSIYFSNHNNIQNFSIHKKSDKILWSYYEGMMKYKNCKAEDKFYRLIPILKDKRYQDIRYTL